MSDPGTLTNLPDINGPVTALSVLLMIVMAFLRGWVVPGAAAEARVADARAYTGDWQAHAERERARADRAEAALAESIREFGRLADAVSAQTRVLTGGGGGA